MKCIDRLIINNPILKYRQLLGSIFVQNFKKIAVTTLETAISILELLFHHDHRAFLSIYVFEIIITVIFRKVHCHTLGGWDMKFVGKFM